MENLSNTSQSFRTHLFHHSRTHLFLCFCVILLLVCEAGICQAEELPHIPGTELQWFWNVKQVQQLAPGTQVGQMLIYQTPFAGFPDTHPVVGQFYFTDNALRHVTYLPKYTYQQAESWQQDYARIQGYVTEIYGEPTSNTDQMILWSMSHTQGRLVFTPNGWITRFDAVKEE